MLVFWANGVIGLLVLVFAWRRLMNVRWWTSYITGFAVLVCALLGVVFKVAAPCWHFLASFLGGGDLCVPPNAFLALALIAVGIIPFFVFLGHGTQPEDMRTAIAVALVTVYVVLVGDVAFFNYQTGTGPLKLDPLAKTMITSFTTTVGIIIPFYFGASAYAQTKDSRTRRNERKKDEQEEDEQ